jgi:caspase domain-containing protein
MKRALLVGIDDYDNYTALDGCVNDVNALTPLLARHEDDSPNFDCHSATTRSARVDRRPLLEDIDTLLAPGADVALFYFAGHGAAAANDVVLVTQDGAVGDPGVPLSAVLGKVQGCSIREVIVVLDCCFSGGVGGVPQLGAAVAALRPGVALLSATRSDQTAAETPAGRGLFSVYFCGALDGGAADVLGRVSVAGVYSYLSESFGAWDQRPTFKANLDRLHDLRRCAPAVPIPALRRLRDLFQRSDSELALDPSYEPTVEPKDADHEATFAVLQQCRAAKLVEPVGAEHMYFAAMQSKACRLTPLGKHYWGLASRNQL